MAHHLQQLTDILQNIDAILIPAPGTQGHQGSIVTNYIYMHADKLLGLPSLPTIKRTYLSTNKRFILY